ncbi:hypothetical protein NC796_20215 [Aliifodinibius sp. S!AR15-10]|uniref:lipopolysaccharide biosynthesis protein n=1 Tax=Aliifodinibius sp. S!AR15-10 TaxID=2950437 RepID=UPI0028662E4C|nr:hypothetical protein [Aliifodinibius sp. S!AR15-10]MDR8393491.1 hypothetical protein [Aliifodinibius sp. S!AR15-10]
MKGGINFLIRGTTLAAKFFFLIFLAKVYEERVLGLYSLAYSTILLVRFILGFEYYTYTGRIISKTNNKKRIGIVISDHFGFLFISTFIAAFIYLLVLFFPTVLDDYLIILLFIVIFEIWGNEIYRLLIYMDQQIRASVLMLVRSGLWMFVLIGIYIIFGKSYSLETIFNYWLVFALVSCAVGIPIINKITDGVSIKLLTPMQYYNRIKKAFYLFVNTVSHRLILTIDKYMVTYFVGVEATGIYSFYVGVAASLNSMIDAGVTSIYYPRLISTYYSNLKRFTRIRKKFKFRLLFLSIALIIAYGILIYPIIIFIDKSSYVHFLYVFYLLLISFGLLSISSLFHYDLYVPGHDFKIGMTSFIGTVFFLISGFVFPIYLGMFGVALSLFLSFITIGILKYLIRPNGKNFIFRSKN